ncbi:MAG TPA: hypothetical protein VG672_03675 [Bryobacteraceae bacterium]|nr:hypothetical protein [Bryobacteraceae bacterium]
MSRIRVVGVDVHAETIAVAVAENVVKYAASGRFRTVGNPSGS